MCCSFDFGQYSCFTTSKHSKCAVQLYVVWLMKHLLVFSVFLFCSVGEVLAVEITRAVMLSNSCAACHGTNGKSPGEIPAINGKSSRFISQALREFREGKRPATVMGRHATGYTDEEIQLIADYFSSLP